MGRGFNSKAQQGPLESQGHRPDLDTQESGCQRDKKRSLRIRACERTGPVADSRFLGCSMQHAEQWRQDQPRGASECNIGLPCTWTKEGEVTAKRGPIKRLGPLKSIMDFIILLSGVVRYQVLMQKRGPVDEGQLSSPHSRGQMDTQENDLFRSPTLSSLLF